MRTAEIETFTFIVTVYVPARSMTAVSVAVGTAAGDQLAGTFQLPPAALFQRTAAAVASEGCSNKPKSPTAASRANARNMMAPLRIGQGGAARGRPSPGLGLQR